ncbi:protein lethal(2)denticleless isoform X2 [Orussus abietinus]|uniref:protein lethal(2)denticleless isoform X2 n=1 Tax=Orussus abietinus TaxID=222816 RepID=UPI000626368D|nr:protein lethal(2)denticleless isoform X2 [Orussus abietinus]
MYKKELESFGDYDFALYRLKCYRDDIYCGISPNTNAPDYNPEPPIFVCRFSSVPGQEHILALANEDGKVALQNTAVNRQMHCPLKGTQAHCNAIFDITWMPGESKLVTASGDHTARLWDVTGSAITEIGHFHGHTRSVKTAVFRYEDKAVFATGARDGAIMIWDIRANHNNQPKPDNTIANAHSVRSARGLKQRRGLTQSSRAQSITGLAFQDDFTLVSCAAGDGLIKVWDIRKNYTAYKREPVAKHTISYCGGSTRNGFTSLLICPARLILYANCMDNIVYAYNIASYSSIPVAEFYGHKNSTFYVKTCLSPDGRYLASGSSDEHAYIWRTDRPGGPMVKLYGHTEEVTCIAWCSVGDVKIVTCSDDSCHIIWRIGPEYKTDDDSEDQIQGAAKAVWMHDAVAQQLGLETTPTVSHRRIYQEHTPDTDTTPGGTPNTSSSVMAFNSKSDNTSSSSKRNYSQMMLDDCRKVKSVLSPIKENQEQKTKRPTLENRGARRLFSAVTDGKVGSFGSYESDSQTPSSSRVLTSEQTSYSPTSNLPNFVIDGTAPHLLEISPRKSKENIDWLTKMRMERYEQKSVRSIVEKSTSPKVHVTPVRRMTRSRSRSSEPRKIAKSPSVSLLNFFRISEKDNEKNLCPGNTSAISS